MVPEPPVPPLYAQIAAELRGEIRQGQYGPGDQLPSETALIGRFGVSQPTIRRAIATLANEGLVDRAQGRGVFVRAEPTLRLAFTRHNAAGRIPGVGPFESTLRQHGLRGGGGLLIEVFTHTASDELAVRLEIEVGALVVYRRRHMELQLPSRRPRIIQIQHSWYPLAVVDRSDLALPQQIPDGVSAALGRLGHAPAVMLEEVGCRLATAEEADVFAMASPVPVLVIGRTTRDRDGLVVEFREEIAAGEAQTFTYQTPVE